MFAKYPVKQDNASIPSRKVLIIEDDADSAVMLQTFLEISGHEASVAPDAENGLRQIESTIPDVIICDIGLPGAINGLEMARSIRAKGGGDAVLLIALSGYGGDENRRRSINAGFDLHLTKPTDLDDLVAVINRSNNKN
jgi:DNA-binding response OmpR family regulator